MDEYIERESTIELLRSLGSRDYRREKGTIQEAIKMVSFPEYTPSADVAPVRHGRCPYCGAETNDFIPLNQTVEYSGIEIALNRQGMLRVRVYEPGKETFSTQDIVEIKHCTNCGAKMDGVDDE